KEQRIEAAARLSRILQVAVEPLVEILVRKHERLLGPEHFHRFFFLVGLHRDRALGRSGPQHSLLSFPQLRLSLPRPSELGFRFFGLRPVLICRRLGGARRNRHERQQKRQRNLANGTVRHWQFSNHSCGFSILSASLAGALSSAASSSASSAASSTR